jgi:serine-type D-Ala-D-Ala carboxypeptidase (penicillin-binding protein 5/6)
MRVPRALAGALLCLVTCGLAGTPAALAAPDVPSPTPPVGGPLLTGRGEIVQPLDGAPALPTGLTASAWVVADADTGEVLAAKAPHAPYLPASTLKILTALTLIPLLDPHQMVKASYRDASVEGSKVGLVPGMRYPVRTLFKAMLVVSGNDAAGALAEAAGGMRHTVDLMNGVAQHLQAFDTVARTPSGLDAPGESTSAYDLALIARAGLQLPDFRDYVGTVRGRVPAPHHKHFQIYTHNRLLTTYRGTIGVKNGYTVAAQATYVGAATRGGHTLIVTLLHAQPYFWDEARQLLSWGFAARGHVAPVGELVDPADPAETTPTASDTPVSGSRTVVLASDHHGAISAWQLAALAASAAVAVVVTARRQRRRSASRLSLPPL